MTAMEMDADEKRQAYREMKDLMDKIEVLVEEM